MKNIYVRIKWTNKIKYVNYMTKSYISHIFK